MGPIALVRRGWARTFCPEAGAITLNGWGLFVVFGGFVVCVVGVTVFWFDFGCGGE